MRKATEVPKSKGILNLSDSDIEIMRRYHVLFSNKELVELQDDIQRTERSIEYSNERIEQNTLDTEQREADIRNYQDSLAEKRLEIEALPKVEEKTEGDIMSELEKTLALPFVSSVEIDSERGFAFITTKPDSLFTSLNKKISRETGNKYTVKSYKIALPEYKFRFNLRDTGGISNESNMLAIILNNEEDTKHFVDIGEYSQEVHAHWGACGVGDIGNYRGICLGEYENDVTRAFRSSLYEGMIALAIYLQTAGTAHAYVNKKENWAVWLGKKEYNLAVLSKENEVISDDDDDEDNEDNEYNEDNEDNN